MKTKKEPTKGSTDMPVKTAAKEIVPVKTEPTYKTDQQPLSPDLLRKMNAYWRPRTICRSARSIFTTIRC